MNNETKLSQTIKTLETLLFTRYELLEKLIGISFYLEIYYT